jgi:FecR protein
VTRHRFPPALWLLGCLMLAGTPDVLAMPTPTEVGDARVSVGATSNLTKLAQAQPAPAPATAPSPAQATADEPIGNVATLTGSATVTRNDTSSQLKLQDDIFLNDVLQTSVNSTLGVTFNDATTFSLTANAKITVDNFVYEDGGKQNKALFDVARGTVAFAAAAVARTGDMKISTPTATLGIRGTTGLVEVPEGVSAASANNVAIKLYPDADGRVGRIEVNDRAGARLGFLTQGSSGFTIRPGAGGRFAALPLAISPQQALRDQGFVRQVHAAQSVGRQIVTQRRIQRLQNPASGNPARQPGVLRQNGLQRQPNAPGVLRPGLQNRPALQKLRPLPAPKGKLPKERR